MSKTITTSATHTTITIPNTNPEREVPSIRQIIMQGILHSRPTAEIAARVQRIHPTSAAAAKSAKHIAWYRADMKKRGELPEQLIEAGIEERAGCSHPSGLAI